MELRMRRVAAAAVLQVAIFLAASFSAAAQDRRHNQPGTVRFLRSLAFLVALVSARLPASAAPRRNSNAARVPIRSWCMGCGRNTSAGFPNFAKCRPRALEPQHHFLHAGFDAGAAADLQRMGQARHLFRPAARTPILRRSARHARP